MCQKTEAYIRYDCSCDICYYIIFSSPVADWLLLIRLIISPRSTFYFFLVWWKYHMWVVCWYFILKKLLVIYCPPPLRFGLYILAPAHLWPSSFSLTVTRAPYFNQYKRGFILLVAVCPFLIVNDPVVSIIFSSSVSAVAPGIPSVQYLLERPRVYRIKICWGHLPSGTGGGQNLMPLFLFRGPVFHHLSLSFSLPVPDY